MYLPALCIATLYLIFSFVQVDADSVRFSSRYGLIGLFIWDVIFLLLTRKYHAV